MLITTNVFLLPTRGEAYSLSCIVRYGLSMSRLSFSLGGGISWIYRVKCKSSLGMFYGVNLDLVNHPFITNRPFCHKCIFIVFVTRVIWRSRNCLPFRSTWIYSRLSGVRVSQLIILCAVSVDQGLSFLSMSFWLLCFLLFMNSNYPKVLLWMCH